jgi:streptogramin lyase
MRRIDTIASLLITIAAAASAACATTPPPASAPAEPAFVARFDAAAKELPEGLLVNDDSAYVGFAPSSHVVRVNLATGQAAPFATLPAPTPGKGFMTGLARASNGDVYAGLASFTPEVQAGVYRIDKAGGAAVLFARDAMLPFPNALAFDPDGSLFVTDSGTGSVFRIDAAAHRARIAEAAEVDFRTGVPFSRTRAVKPGVIRGVGSARRKVSA